MTLGEFSFFKASFSVTRYQPNSFEDPININIDNNFECERDAAIWIEECHAASRILRLNSNYKVKSNISKAKVDYRIKA